MAASVGIDDLNIYASTLQIDVQDIAMARVGRDKQYGQIGFLQRSVLPSYEDPVTLAVNAAKPIVEANDPGSFELLIVGTETGVDWGKPISTYVHRYLGLQDRCRNFELKHACYAGTAGLQMASSWVRSVNSPATKALVITTDIARRHINEPSELQLSAGAVAMSVSLDPSILEFEPYSGYATREVYDVARPTITSEYIDPTRSLGAFLDLAESSWLSYKGSAGPVRLDEHFKYMALHTPLVSLVRQAFQSMMELDYEDIEPGQVDAAFERMVEPGLAYSRQIGNIYSGTVYAVLASLIDCAPSLDPGTRIGLYSYGSGSCAEVYSGLVRERAREIIRSRRFQEHFSQRVKIDVPTYENATLQVERSLAARDFEPDWDDPAGHFDRMYRGKGRLVLEHVRNHYRTYRWS